MLSNDEFGKIFKELSVTWPKAYNSEQAKMLYLSIRKLSTDEFKEVCTSILAERKTAPSVFQIKAKCQPYLDKYAQRAREYQQKQNTMCPDCGGKGMVLRRRKGAPAYEQDYAFRCPCGAADAIGISESIPTWDVVRFENFEESPQEARA